VLVSITDTLPGVDPLRAFQVAPPSEGRAFWEGQGHDPERHSQRLTLAGIGEAEIIATKGPDRFVNAARSWRALLEDALIMNAYDRWGVGPLLMGGFCFDPLRPRTELWRNFPDALLTLPRLIVASSDGESWLTMNTVLYPDSDADVETDRLVRRRDALFHAMAARPRLEPAILSEYKPPLLQDVLPADEWQRKVADSAAAIQQGRFEKVVLARQARMQGRFGATGALTQLRTSYPDSTLFGIMPSSAEGRSTFVGASPERLVRLQRGIVETTCLAGSIRRGTTEVEDAQLGRELLNSAKDRDEHAVVARMLRAALRPLCDTLTTYSEAPTLLRLANVQHLYTPITGRLRGNKCILELVAELHPTPAVGGFPCEAALTAIRECEGLDRGWYAAPVGWVDQHGEGEFAVALRSALLRTAHPNLADDRGEGEALLFAGCGIMGDSNPESEYEESRLKMRAVYSALTAM